MGEMRILMEHLADPDQAAIETYEKKGGYQTLKRALAQANPSEITEAVLQSGLKGRGGAGFLTGKKWEFLPKDPSIPVYLVCNCDESEPGTFKDRLLVEKDPHQLIEGLILSAYAIGCRHAFIYCRGEYFKPLNLLRKALIDSKAKGYWGRSVLGSSYSLEITLHPGAGAYIAGEETALLESLEGYRALPRLKPPFPASQGLYRKPTIINNVETLCNVVHIVKKGAAWYREIGTENSRGTKIFQVSGQVKRPGCFEFPFGVRLREVLEAAGWMLPGRQFKACYPGGSSCSLLHASDLDMTMDFETLEKRGSALGTASIIVLDDTADMVKVAHRLMEFYQHESCGKCTPCREGTRWVVQMLARILEGKGTFEDLPKILQVCRSMAGTSFCPLAVGAAPPVISALEGFKSEFEAYVNRNPRKDQVAEMKVAYPYTPRV